MATTLALDRSFGSTIDRPAINQGPAAVAAAAIALAALYLNAAVSGRQALLFLVGAAAGVALYHAAFGFTSVFVLSIALEATALVLMLWLVEEPRKRRLQSSVMSREAIGETEEELEAELIEETSASRGALDPEP